MAVARRIRRNRRGYFEVRLAEEERHLLASLVEEMRTTLKDGAAGTEPDQSLRRLFPVAYPDDPGRDAEYSSLVHDDLLARRLSVLDTTEKTIEAERLSEAEMLCWMGAINDIRLVLGTRLDVSEETDLEPVADDPHGPALAVYGYLGYLLETIVAALAG